MGDMFHSNGLAQSVDATVTARTGKITGAIMEVMAVIEDMRMQVMGGMMGALDLWNHALIPSLLANCGTWTEISKGTLSKLEDLQNLFLRRVPTSTPKIALRAEAGLLSMKHRVGAEKVALAAAIRKMPKTSLSRQVMEEQIRFGWPGLAKEVEEICEDLCIPNVLEEDVPKQHIQESIRFHNCEEIRTEMKRRKKLKNIIHEDFSMTKPYMQIKSIGEGRTLFRIRTNMMELRANKKGSHKMDLTCVGCRDPESEEDQTHVLKCSAYENLQHGLNFMNDQDLVIYFQKVMVERLK